jgi:hypothetical protein
VSHRAAVVAVITALLIACEPRKDCVDICTNLERCGLLPSPLGVAAEGGIVAGTARDDCIGRCDRTALRAGIGLPLCLGVSEVLLGSGQLDWCSHQPDGGHTHFSWEVPKGATGAGRAAPPSTCEQLASCLDSQFGVFARGRARLVVVPAVGASIRPAEALSCNRAPPTSLSPPDLFRAGLSDDQARSVCRALGATSGTVFHEVAGEHHEIERHSCAFVLEHAADPVDVPPGPAKAGIKLFAAFSPADDEACWVFHSERTIVAAGVGYASLLVPVPEDGVTSAAKVLPCEAGRAACSDNVDNDFDGFTDCADAECLALARAQPDTVRCSGAGGRDAAAGD